MIYGIIELALFVVLVVYVGMPIFLGYILFKLLFDEEEEKP